MVPLVAECYGCINVREKLQLVLDIFRREHRTIVKFSDIVRPVDDTQMAFLVEEAGIASATPSIFCLGLSSRFRILVVLLENTGTFEDNFAIVLDADFDVVNRPTDGIHTNLVVRLYGHEHARLSHTV